jgi:hypothetical protein
MGCLMNFLEFRSGFAGLFEFKFIHGISVGMHLVRFHVTI